MTIDKNQAAMVEQSPLSEKHWRPDDDGTITIYWPAFFSEARDLLCLSCTVCTHTSTSSQCVCAWGAITFLHMYMYTSKKCCFQSQGPHFCEIAPPGWNVKLDQATSRARGREAVHQLELFCARRFPWSPTAENGVLEIIVEVFDEMVRGSPFLVHPQDSRSVSVFRC